MALNEILVWLGIALALPFLLLLVGWLLHRKIRNQQDEKSQIPTIDYGNTWHNSTESDAHNDQWDVSNATKGGLNE